LAAVSQSERPVHQSTLLRAVRTTYNIFLLSGNSANQTIAQGTLTQMVNIVFSRVRLDPKLRRPDQEEEEEEEEGEEEEEEETSKGVEEEKFSDQQESASIHGSSKSEQSSSETTKDETEEAKSVAEQQTESTAEHVVEAPSNEPEATNTSSK
jgi:brefeldin A-inhibited guanine nucleotide-exchange protein